MKLKQSTKRILSALALVALFSSAGLTSISTTTVWSHDASHELQDSRRWIQVAAHDKFERSTIANIGMSIEAVRSDSVWGFADLTTLKLLQAQGFNILGTFDVDVGRGGHQGSLGFPDQDKIYHTYDQAVADLRTMSAANADITRLVSIGKTIEGRDILALHINTQLEALRASRSTKPGVIYMGNHHAREHLTVEVPLKLAKYLLDNRRSPVISKLLDSRDIWIIPMVNPDGSEYDVASNRYRYWRKNRRDNKDGNFGVDLNRNYSFKWGTGGSSNNTSSETYMGPAPFSEPETQAIRDFVRGLPNTKVLLTLHSFSELVLYPWGNTHDKIGNAKDHAVFEKMAKTMAQWNHYTAEQTSDLYIASGDTTDWAYGELGIFAFTFELSPGEMSGSGGFYPGPKMIEKAFNDNLKPCLYLLDVAGDPYAVVNSRASRFLSNYAEPTLPSNPLDGIRR